MRIEVAWIGAGEPVVRGFEVPAGATVGSALAQAAADPALSASPWASGPVGVFGRLVTREQPLVAGDRIELYRGGAVDAKAARRARAGRARR